MDWTCKPGSVRTSAQQSSIFTVRYRTVQAFRLRHLDITDGQPADKSENQGVASDRVYSEPMLP